MTTKKSGLGAMLQNQHDGTDLKIALMLTAKGVPKSDIVLGFHAPSEHLMIEEFAVS